MRQFVVLVLVGIAAASCSKTPDAAKQKTPEAWSRQITLQFDPADRTVKPGRPVRIWVDNKTGENVTFEWSSAGTCGELVLDKDKPAQAQFVGRGAAKECKEDITLKVSAAKGTYEKRFGVTILGDKAFAELTVRFDPMPDSWLVINDYENTLAGQEVKCFRTEGKTGAKPSVGLAVDAKKEKEKSQAERDAEKAKAAKGGEYTVTDVFTDQHLNSLRAPFDPWQFEGGSFTFGEPPEGEKGVLALHYDLPYDDAYGGYFENLRLEPSCETGPFDTAEYETITFIVKSGDGKPHKVYLEVTAWEKYSEYHQGRTEAAGPFDVPAKEWKRYEVPIRRIIKTDLDPHTIKSINFRMNRGGQEDSGVVLFDNLALIRKK
jgi:plastocyanin